MIHPESEWSQAATIIVDNRDKNLTALDLTGYKATISYGYNTSAGDEYSACAPLIVMSQRDDTLFRQGDLQTIFRAKGIFDMMADDEADDNYFGKDDDNFTVRDFLIGVATGSGRPYCFNHCKLWAITFDSGYDDGIINDFKPADYFQVNFKESRLSAFKKLLAFTKCKARVEADYEIHIFQPTISGTTYDYEYNDAVTGHNFFEKSVRNRIVIPNRVYVSSHPDHQPVYRGNAIDVDSANALGRYIKEFHWMRLESNAQAAAIAAAKIQNYQIGQEKGHGYAPLNCGQEVIDYVKITDSAAGDTRVGNIGYLTRITGPEIFEFDFGFGALGLGGVENLASPLTGEVTGLADRVAILAYRLQNVEYWLNEAFINQQAIALRLEALWNRELVSKMHIEDQAIIPVEA